MDFIILLSEVSTLKILLFKCLNTSLEAVVVAVRLYYFLLTLRFTIQWFPTINPFINPFFVLQVLTDPYLELFNDFFPILLGMDLSAIVAFTFLEWVIFTLNSIKFYP